MPLKILLIDADLRYLQAVRRELEGEFVVLGCGRGLAALDLFKLFRPQAVVASGRMEGFSLPDFLDQARRLPWAARIPVWVTNGTGVVVTRDPAREREHTVLLEGPAHPSLIRAHLNWHFGGRLPAKAGIHES